MVCRAAADGKQSLKDYALSGHGISEITISEARFLFGEESGWYDCHYTVYFDCYMDGDDCIGEARAFLKYAESQVQWFHFEVFRCSDMESVIEEYDSSYDEGILEEYYKELVRDHP